MKVPIISLKDYLDLEIASNTKYEFHDGKVYALAGGTINHGRLCGNIYSEIRQGLKGKQSDCEAFTSEIKLHIHKKNTYVYPDTMVVCGDVDTANEDSNSVTNPMLIVEVLSKSTSDYDRGEKFHLYRQIPSLQEYVLIEQDKKIVEVYYKKKGSDLWSITRYETQDKVLILNSINIEISINDLYNNINIEEEA